MKLVLSGRYSPPIVIPAPEIFCISDPEARFSLLVFLAALRHPFIERRTGSLLIDMHSTKRFVADGTLLFYAELSRLLELSAGRMRVRIRPPANIKADQVLCQIGAYRICGMDRQRKSNYGDVVHWQVAYGHTVDNTICAPAIEAFEGKLASPLVNGLFKGLGEAMTNTRQHAYLYTRDDGLSYQQPTTDWWLFSQARDNTLSVVFCDLGIGIPKSLPIKRKGLFQKLLSMGLSSSDSACIEQAIEETRSSTQLPHRGRGLGNIVDVVSKYQTGLVVIFSNQGYYMLKGGKAVRYDFRDSIMGTLIYWQVPLQ